VTVISHQQTNAPNRKNTQSSLWLQKNLEAAYDAAFSISVDVILCVLKAAGKVL
jgi:hypothetical protein